MCENCVKSRLFFFRCHAHFKNSWTSKKERLRVWFSSAFSNGTFKTSRAISCVCVYANALACACTCTCAWSWNFVHFEILGFFFEFLNFWNSILSEFLNLRNLDFVNFAFFDRGQTLLVIAPESPYQNPLTLLRNTTEPLLAYEMLCRGKQIPRMFLEMGLGSLDCLEKAYFVVWDFSLMVRLWFSLIEMRSAQFLLVFFSRLISWQSFLMWNERIW